MIGIHLLGQAVPNAALSADPTRASTSLESRREAIASIPFDKMKRDIAATVRGVVTKPSIYRRLPISMIDCDRELFIYLIRYPEVVVNMWQLMDITKLQLRRTDDYTFHADDGAGTKAKVDLVYGTSDIHVLYAEGFYEGPLMKRKTKGRCVLVLTSGYSNVNDGTTYVSSQLDVFVRVDGIGAELVAKTLQSLVGKTADFNFSETNRFISEVSRAAETKWNGVERLVGRLNNIESDVRDEFGEIASTVRQRKGNRTELSAARLSESRRRSLPKPVQRLEPVKQSRAVSTSPITSNTLQTPAQGFD